MKRQLTGVHAGDIWRDRDRRMMSGNRLVRVTSVLRDDKGTTVFYRNFAGNQEWGTTLKSRYERFQRAFDPVKAQEVA
jgi:hypothetical protein